MLYKDWAYELVGFFILLFSLDLPFSSSLIILLISSALQSYRKILLGFEPGMKVLKLGMSSFCQEITIYSHLVQEEQYIFL